MNLKVVFAGAILELSYLGYLIVSSFTEMGAFYLEISPRVLELVKHTWFQAIVLLIILIGAFMNGKDNAENKSKKKGAYFKDLLKSK